MNRNYLLFLRICVGLSCRGKDIKGKRTESFGLSIQLNWTLITISTLQWGFAIIIITIWGKIIKFWSSIRSKLVMLEIQWNPIVVRFIPYGCHRLTTAIYAHSPISIQNIIIDSSHSIVRGVFIECQLNRMALVIILIIIYISGNPFLEIFFNFEIASNFKEYKTFKYPLYLFIRPPESGLCLRSCI